MNDEQQIRGELTRLAADDPLGPIDSARLVDRGRRGKRRRRILASGGAVAAVSAVALTASLLPNLSAADSRPSPAGTSSSNAVAHLVPLPGVPRGDAALAAIDRAEMFRRCELRGQRLDKRGEFQGGAFPAWYPVSQRVMMLDAARRRQLECAIPGDSRPSETAIAAAKADPLPSDDAGRLRNCSAELWHDVTRYRVLASDTLPGQATNLVAMSPSGKYVVFCTLEVERPRIKIGSRSYERRLFHTVNAAYHVSKVRTFAGYERADRLSTGGTQTCGAHKPGTEPKRACIGATYSGAGRWNPRITRIVINNSNGNKHEIKLNDGWYALVWANGNRNNPDDRATAYDANGNEVPITKSNDPDPLAPPLR